MIVWGGSAFLYRFQYRRALRSGNRQLEANEHAECTERTSVHTAVWTGSEMIVWGGFPVPTPAGATIREATAGGQRARRMHPAHECSHRGLDRERNDRLGGMSILYLPQHRRALRSGNRQLEANEHAECTQRTKRLTLRSGPGMK